MRLKLLVILKHVFVIINVCIKAARVIDSLPVSLESLYGQDENCGASSCVDGIEFCNLSWQGRKYWIYDDSPGIQIGKSFHFLHTYLCL